MEFWVLVSLISLLNHVLPLIFLNLYYCEKFNESTPGFTNLSFRLYKKSMCKFAFFLILLVSPLLVLTFEFICVIAASIKDNKQKKNKLKINQR